MDTGPRSCYAVQSHVHGRRQGALTSYRFKQESNNQTEWSREDSASQYVSQPISRYIRLLTRGRFKFESIEGEDDELITRQRAADRDLHRATSSIIREIYHSPTPTFNTDGYTPEPFTNLLMCHMPGFVPRERGYSSLSLSPIRPASMTPTAPLEGSVTPRASTPECQATDTAYVKREADN